MNRSNENRLAASSAGHNSNRNNHYLPPPLNNGNIATTPTTTTTTTTTAEETADIPMVNMVRCIACSHLVPENNLAIHQVRACPGNAPRVPIRSDEERDDDDMDAVTMETINVPDDSHHMTATTTTAVANNSNSSNTAATPGVPTAASASDIIDLTFHDDFEEQWTCDRCTLFNDLSDQYCAACGSNRPRVARSRNSNNLDDDDDACRNPDPIRREQLLPDDQWLSATLLDDSPSFSPPPSSSATTPTSMVLGGGAIVGGVLGAAGAFLQGRPMSSAVLEGAVTGAVGAAVAQQAWQQHSTSPPRRRRASHTVLPRATAGGEVASARSSATLGLPPYPSFASASATTGQHRQRPRSSMQVIRRISPDGSTHTTVVQAEGSTTIRTTTSNRRSNNNFDNDDAAALLAAVQEFLVHSPLMLGPNQHLMQRNQLNVDGMSYEQLLEAFGDGTEGRGASETTIHSLPTQVLQDPQKELTNPELQTCSICLEQYQTGQTRKCMPCLHGFHQECIDTWLRSNASCPICKHELS